MLNQFSNKDDDSALEELFKDFEKIIPDSKSYVDWFISADFQCFREYLVKDIKKMQQMTETANENDLYYLCQHIFNIKDWFKLMVEDAGFPTFGTAWELVFDKHFGDKYILQSLYNACFEKWIAGKNGQYKIGENFYNILDDKLFYRNCYHQWFEVSRETVFDLKPSRELTEETELIERLNKEYKETWYDEIISRWKDKKYQGKIPKDFLYFGEKETDPGKYLDFTLSQIRKVLENPISIEELERWNGEEMADLEHLVKIAVFVLRIVKNRRIDDSQTLYLLRDSLIFLEAQKIVDILEGKNTSSDQILVGRKLLSHKPEHWGYYAVMLEVLYSAHIRYPTDFKKFYDEYARLMDMFVSLNTKFAAIVRDIADYIKKHVGTDKNKIIVFDIGFQGSIALLTKYIIDRYVERPGSQGKFETEIEIGVGAQWSKELFGNRYDSDYFPMLNRIQLLTRSEKLYQYKEDSLRSGSLQVTMGNTNNQHKAAVELVALAMVSILTLEK